MNFITSHFDDVTTETSAGNIAWFFLQPPEGISVTTLLNVQPKGLMLCVWMTIYANRKQSERKA